MIERIQFDTSIRGVNMFTIKIKHVSEKNMSLMDEFINENGANFYMNNGSITITATPLELINILKYMGNLKFPYSICNRYGYRLGSASEVLDELSRMNRNIQINELV